MAPRVLGSVHVPGNFSVCALISVRANPQPCPSATSPPRSPVYPRSAGRRLGRRRRSGAGRRDLTIPQCGTIAAPEHDGKPGRRKRQAGRVPVPRLRRPQQDSRAEGGVAAISSSRRSPSKRQSIPAVCTRGSFHPVAKMRGRRSPRPARRSEPTSKPARPGEAAGRAGAVAASSTMAV